MTVEALYAAEVARYPERGVANAELRNDVVPRPDTVTVATPGLRNVPKPATLAVSPVSVIATSAFVNADAPRLPVATTSCYTSFSSL